MTDKIYDKSKATPEAWRELAAKQMRGGSVDDLVWDTAEGIPVKPCIPPPTWPTCLTPTPCPACRRIFVAPGHHVCRRPGLSASTPAFPPPRNPTPLPQGAGRRCRGVSVAFDLATHRGYDSDHPRGGRCGQGRWAIDSVEDMKILFDGIPLDKVSVSMTMNGAVLPVLAGLHCRRRRAGRAQAQLTGTIQNDILKEFMVRNTYIYPPETEHENYRRYHCLLFQPHAALQYHFHLRLPHPGSRARTRRWNWPTPWRMARSIFAPRSPRAWVSTILRPAVVLLGVLA